MASRLEKVRNSHSPLKGKVLYIGHRGLSGSYPENTMLAYKKSFESGANGIEIDLRFTKDKKIVLIHDDDVDRTTDFSGLVADYTFDEIVNMDAGKWKGTEFSNRVDTKVPSLEEVLDYFNGTEVIIELDIKESQVIDQAVQMVRDRNMESNCFFVGKKQDILYIKSNYPDLISYYAGPYDEPIDYRINDLLSYEINIMSWRNISQNLIRKAHKNDLFVRHSWQTEHMDNVAFRLLNLGVDMYLTDNPDLMKSLGDRLGLEQFNSDDVYSLFFNERKEQTVK